ncbi:MAG: hypothetical protein LPJ91_05210 [Pseudazoarcus pumilus]|nr:hypothetical protein [Pseudazoarcus pumilus]
MKQTVLRWGRIWLCCALFAACLPAMGGERGKAGQFPELSMQIAFDVREIMIRHGMPLSHEGEDPWFSVQPMLNFVGVGEVSYLLYLDRMNEVPMAARMEIVEYCMRLHESVGGREYIRLQMRATPRQQALLRPKPDFELVLNDVR